MQSAMPVAAPETMSTVETPGVAPGGVSLPVTTGLVRGLDIEGCGDLRVFLSGLPDPRRRQGRRYAYGALVALCAAAMLGGANSVAGIFRWGRDAPEEVLLALGITAHKRTGQIWPPSLKTLRRLLKDLDGTALDHALA